MLFCFAPMFTRGMERNDVKHIPVPPGRGNPTPPGRPKTLKCCHASVSSSTLLCPCLGGPCLLWDCLQMLVTSSHRLGIPSPAVTQLRALLPLPIFKTYIKKAFFFLFFFFSRVFLPVSQNEMYLTSVLGLPPLQRLHGHSRKVCFGPRMLTMTQTFTLLHRGFEMFYLF